MPFEQRCGIDCCGWTVIPLNGQCVERGLGMPPRVRDHGDTPACMPAPGVPYYRMDAGHGLDPGRVVALDVPSPHRAGLGRSVEDARQPNIDRIHRLTGHLRRHIEVL